MIMRNISLSKSLFAALLSSALMIACSGDTNQMEDPVAVDGEGGDGMYSEMESEQDYLDSPELSQDDGLFPEVESVDGISETEDDYTGYGEEDEIDQPAAEEFAEEAISEPFMMSDEDDLTSSDAELSAAAFEDDESIDARPVEDVTLTSDTDPTFLNRDDSSVADPDFGFESMDTVAVDDSSYHYQEPAVSKPAPVVSQTSGSNTYTSAGRSASGDGSYIVQPGDTLSQISQMIYGTSKAWQRLAQENGIQSPFKIHPGDELRFDSSDQAASSFASAYSASSFSTVTVGHGDTLSKIAKRIFGSAAGWRTLFAYNASKIRNPDLIYVGMQLSYREPKQTAHRGGSSNNESH